MYKDSKLIAAIDIGSNSVLLTIVKIFKSGFFRILEEGMEVPRLSAGLKKRGRIKSTSIKKCIVTLNKFNRRCREHNVSKIFCIGTEVFRKATNSTKVVKIIKKHTGLDVKIISPVLEAKLSFISATEEMKLKELKNAVVIDIGAGSTELVNSDNKKVSSTVSIPVGSLYLKDYFALKYPAGKQKILEISDYVLRIFQKSLKKKSVKTIIGVGGTITSIPTINEKAQKYSRGSVDFYKVKRQAIDNLIAKLSKKTLKELKKTKGMPRGRADILLPGLIILSELMKLLKSSSLTVRNRGLRFGILFLYTKKQYGSKRIKMIA